MSVSAAQWAAIRADAAARLPSTCVIRSRTLVSDGRLGATATTTDVTAACRVVEIGVGREDVLEGKLRAHGDFTIRLPYGTAVAKSDQILWSGRTLEVVRVSGRDDAALLTIYASEIG